MASTLVKTKAQIPSELASFLGDVALWGDEKPEDFKRVFDAIVSSVKPQDGLDWIWTKGIAELAFEIRRYRRMKLLLVRSRETDSESELFTARLLDLSPKKRAGKDSEDDVLAHSFLAVLPQLEIVEKMLASAETRMVAFVREIELRNKARARQYEMASKNVIEGKLNTAAA